MKIARLIIVAISISIIMVIQGCGSDTAGALTMTAPTVTDNGAGMSSVSTKVTYAPPTGKSAEGVEVNITVTDNISLFKTYAHKFTSGSNSFDYSFIVSQDIGSSRYLSVVSSIGDMKASSIITVPGITPMSAQPIDFIAGEAVSPGTTKTTTISGGVGPYILTSSSTVNGVLTNISIAGTVLSVKYISTTTASLLTTQVIITDGVGSTLNIPVTYYK